MKLLINEATNAATNEAINKVTKVAINKATNGAFSGHPSIYLTVILCCISSCCQQFIHSHTVLKLE